MRAARNYAQWSEHHHYRTAGDFRRGLAEILGCLDETLPWDDVRRVIQGWGIVQFRLRWAGVLGGGMQDEEESEDEESEDEESEDGGRGD